MEFDFVIIGAGSAGCVLANRLTQDGRHSVLLLEAGPADRNPWIHIPIGYGKTMLHPVLNWGFWTEGEPNMNGRKVYWPRGRTLGGSSAVNGLIQIRGQAEDFDAWEAQGAAGWGMKDVEPYFRKSLELLSVETISQKNELVDAFIAGARDLGLPENRDFNGPSQEGAGYLQLTTRRGRRHSAATAYLKPARGRPNLAVRTGAHVTGLMMEGRRATGARFLQGGEVRTVRARREVILSAGALQTPQLLQLSGIGPGSLLQRYGIPVVVDSAGVGANLQDHLALRLVYKCTRPVTTNDELKNVFRMAQTGLRYLLFRSGPMAIGVMTGGLITKVLPESKTPDMQVFLSTVSAEQRGSAPHKFSGFTQVYYPLRPTSRGTVMIQSGDPLRPPAIHANYLFTDYDQRAMIAGAKLCRRLAAAPSFAPYVKEELQPGPKVQSDGEILDAVREHGSSGYHPCGTCSMGNSPRTVVDARLRVRGAAALRVVDASVMPTVVSGNTNAATMMIAEKGADLILADAA
jgi:choline dehydrogenase